MSQVTILIKIDQVRIKNMLNIFILQNFIYVCILIGLNPTSLIIATYINIKAAIILMNHYQFYNLIILMFIIR